MMAAPSYAPMGNPPPAVVNPAFCVPYPVELNISRKLMTIGDNFVVVDVTGNVMFRAKGSVFSFTRRHRLLDAYNRPVLSFEQKIMSVHGRWKVYRGDSSDPRDLLFSVKKSSVFQMRTSLHVFLASNTSEDAYDFKLKGSWYDRSCTIYAGNTDLVLAQMHRKLSVQNIVFGQDAYAVTVYPYVDYAFISALVVILEEMNEEKRSS